MDTQVKLTPAVRRVIKEMKAGAVLHYLPPGLRVASKYWLLSPNGERRDIQERTARILRFNLRLIEIATRGKHSWNMMTFKLTKDA